MFTPAPGGFEPLMPTHLTSNTPRASRVSRAQAGDTLTSHHLETGRVNHGTSSVTSLLPQLWYTGHRNGRKEQGRGVIGSTAEPRLCGITTASGGWSQCAVFLQDGSYGLRPLHTTQALS